MTKNDVINCVYIVVVAALFVFGFSGGGAILLMLGLTVLGGLAVSLGVFMILLGFLWLVGFLFPKS